MKKLLLPVMLLSAIALSGATVPAVAVEAAPVAVVESAPIVADSGAVLSAVEPSVETVAAPVVLEPVAVPVEPVTVPAPNVEPSPTATATTAPVAVPVAPAEPSVAPVATEPVENYPAPPPTVQCYEDQPCWDCATMGNKICGNPACAAQNLFTVENQECSTTPYGWNKQEARDEAHRLAVEHGIDPYRYAGSQAKFAPRREGFVYIDSVDIPGMVHVF